MAMELAGAHLREVRIYDNRKRVARSEAETRVAKGGVNERDKIYEKHHTAEKSPAEN